MTRVDNVIFRAAARASCLWAASRTQHSIGLAAPLRKYLPSLQVRNSSSRKGGSKIFKSADGAIADVRDGSVILSAGFGLCGVAGEYAGIYTPAKPSEPY
jgi:3-oxoacid CoA-transferase